MYINTTINIIIIEGTHVTLRMEATYLFTNYLYLDIGYFTHTKLLGRFLCKHNLFCNESSIKSLFSYKMYIL
jgi:hypothetical protein